MNKRFFVIFWLFFIVLGLLLAVNGFEQHLIYSIKGGEYSFDWSFLAGLLISAGGAAQLIIYLKGK